MHKVRGIHMVGIGGSGMSGIAEVLLNLGYTVTGSDLSNSATVERLRSLGATIYHGHAAENVGDVEVLVRSTAIGDDNPEVIIGRERNLSIIPRAEMLAELMRLRQGIAIAGTHGKTTTTSLTATIFDTAGKDPTVVVGGLLNAYGANAHLGEGDYLIAEADESDGSFLCLFPIVNVVTNVDLDHVDFYANMDEMDKAFTAFMNKVPFYGRNIVCGDDEGVRRLLPRVKRPVTTYGFGKDNMLRAKLLECAATSRFEVFFHEESLGEMELSQPGKHNVLNALAAIGVALEAGISIELCREGLRRFGGVGRRFEHKGVKNGVIVIDDYGHHPAEIVATIATAKQVYPNKRLVVAFQPHRFTRTKAFFGEFCRAFDGVDKLLLTEVYAANEKPIPGVSGQSLTQGLLQVSNVDVTYCQDLEGVIKYAQDFLHDGDIFLTLGAGTITRVGPMYINDSLK